MSGVRVPPPLLGLFQNAHNFRETRVFPHFMRVRVLRVAATDGCAGVCIPRFSPASPPFSTAFWQCVLRLHSPSWVFRGKLLADFKEAHQASEAGELPWTGGPASLAQPEEFQRYLSELYGRDWVVYAKPAANGLCHLL